MSLKIKLKPHDKIIVNGAVIAADDKPTVIIFLNKARILRQDDILLDTQIREAMAADGGYYNESWLYYLIQLIYIDPENSADVQPQLESTVALLCGQYPEKVDDINGILTLMVEGNFFKALKACKKVFPNCLMPKRKMKNKPESNTHHGQTSTAV